MSILAIHPAKLQIVSRRHGATAKIPDLPTSEAIMAAAMKAPVRLSEMFMRYWCGQDGPTEELELWLRDRGFLIEHRMDPHAGWASGWEVRQAGTETGHPGETMDLFSSCEAGR